MSVRRGNVVLLCFAVKLLLVLSEALAPTPLYGSSLSFSSSPSYSLLSLSALTLTPAAAQVEVETDPLADGVGGAGAGADADGEAVDDPDAVELVQPDIPEGYEEGYEFEEGEEEPEDGDEGTELRTPRGSNKAGRVKVLTVANFEHDTQAATGATTGDWAVLFYSDGCSHCVVFKPTWHKLAEEYNIKHNTNIAAVRCDADWRICTRFKIQATPTILLFRHGRMYPYDGERKLAALREFVTNPPPPEEGFPVPPELGYVGEFFDAIASIDYELVWGEMMQVGRQHPLIFVLWAALVVIGVACSFAICTMGGKPPQSRAQPPAAAAAGTKAVAADRKKTTSRANSSG